MPPPAPDIDFATFQSLDLRVGRVTRVKVNEGARVPAYCLWIDLGDELGVRQSSAQLTARYDPEDLLNRIVVAAVNLGTRRVNGFRSDVLVLGVPDADDATILLSVERDVPIGGRVH